MKKSLTLVFAILLQFSSIYGQKVDIDNHKFYVEYANLPSNHIPQDQRTYTIEVVGDNRFNPEVIEDQIFIRGWEKNDEAAASKALIDIRGFSQGRSSVKNRESVRKDKNGKVISRTYYYSVSNSNSGNASLTLYGPKNEYVPFKKLKDKKKKDKKKKKKSKKEKKEKVNPFLQGVDIKTDDAPKLDKSEIAKKYNLNNSYTYTTQESTRRATASEEFRLNSGSAYNKHLDEYENYIIRVANNSLNSFYGYTRKRDYAKFKRLDSDKHPEFEMFENAVQAMRAILEKKRFNIDPTEVKEAMMPIIDYYISVKEKYSQDKKHPKRLKAAAMYNLAQIYYYLDMPEEVIKIGKEYLAWGHDKGDGEDFIEKGEELANLLKFHQIPGRYIVTEEDADSIESEDAPAK